MKNILEFTKKMIQPTKKLRIIARKFGNSQETLKMGKHFLKDNHILKLNILGCDNFWNDL